MEKEAIIRPLKPEDAEAFRTIRLEALRLHPESFGSSYEAEVQQDVEVFRERLNRSLVVGAFRDELVGIANLGIQTMEKMAHRATLFGIYVRESERGAGLAKKMIQMLFVAAQRSKIEQLELSVVTDNTDAKGLYESLGFKEYGTQPRAMKVQGKYYDEYTMVKFLNDNA